MFLGQPLICLQNSRVEGFFVKRIAKESVIILKTVHNVWFSNKLGSRYE